MYTLSDVKIDFHITAQLKTLTVNRDLINIRGKKSSKSGKNMSYFKSFLVDESSLLYYITYIIYRIFTPEYQEKLEGIELTSTGNNREYTNGVDIHIFCFTLLVLAVSNLLTTTPVSRIRRRHILVSTQNPCTYI